MSAPMKPWEQTRILQSSAPMLQNYQGTNTGRTRAVAPALPPRPNMMRPSTYLDPSYNRFGGSLYNSYDSYNSYGGMGGGFGRYGGGGMYGGFGGYGGPYGNSGYGFGPESRFIQLAEESTRPAFQGIESLVRAFGSIAMMFDSTFFAVQSSFRAVLGVAENFGRIRTMFGQLWSSFALLRFINWCYKKLMSLLGVQVTEDLGKTAWNEAVQGAANEEIKNASSWPIFMFLGMIVSAPYLISKLLPPVIDKRDPKNWDGPAKLCRAAYPFQASSSQELSLMPGDKVLIAPMAIQQEMNLSNSGWVYASSERGTGVVPLNYIGLMQKKGSVATPMSKQKLEEDFSSITPIVKQEHDEVFGQMKEEFDKLGNSSQKDK